MAGGEMMNKNKRMKTRVHEYIKWKRGLGYQQTVESRELLRFAKFSDVSGHTKPVTN